MFQAGRKYVKKTLCVFATLADKLVLFYLFVFSNSVQTPAETINIILLSSSGTT